MRSRRPLSSTIGAVAAVWPGAVAAEPVVEEPVRIVCTRCPRDDPRRFDRTGLVAEIAAEFRAHLVARHGIVVPERRPGRRGRPDTTRA